MLAGYEKKELGQYPAILTEQAWSITHIYCGNLRSDDGNASWKYNFILFILLRDYFTSTYPTQWIAFFLSINVSDLYNRMQHLFNSFNLYRIGELPWNQTGRSGFQANIYIFSQA